MRWWLAALYLAFGFVRDAEPCAIAPPDPTSRVAIVDEEALIAWDPASKTEHFIRRAQFDSDAKSFGFLVPTPTPPKLAEVDGLVFYQLVDAIAPVVEEHVKRPWRLGSWLFESCMLLKGESQSPMSGPPQNSVRVISTANVAGFDATSVQADDPHALAGWLGQHGFASTPELEAWLAKYVADKWTITAFVVASSQNSPDVATRAVDMAFSTPQPFYPYREPASAVSAPARTLRVYLAAPERMSATLAGKPWAAAVSYAAPVTVKVQPLVDLVGAKTYLTAFEDRSSPRRAIDELYFAATPGLPEVKPPPYVYASSEPRTIPLDVILIVGVFALWLRGKIRRIRRRA